MVIFFDKQILGHSSSSSDSSDNKASSTKSTKLGPKFSNHERTTISSPSCPSAIQSTTFSGVLYTLDLIGFGGLSQSTKTFIDGVG
ncbi:hypothetical protein LINPERHAP1_LOCUS27756, partial [Linum perenne]